MLPQFFTFVIHGRYLRLSTMHKLNSLILTTLLLLTSNLAFSGNINLIPINAKFETTTCDLPCNHSANQIKTQWWLLRHHQQVETRKDGSNNSQLWLKSAENQLSYFYMLHDEKRAIEYAAVDLNMLGIATNQSKWQTVTSLIAEADLANMKKNQTEQKYETYQLAHYSGFLNGIQTEVLWVAELQIPLQISYTTTKQRVTIDLINRYNENLPIQATTQQTLMTYQQVDYSDIGDIEHSSTSAKWLDKVDGAPGINSHQH